MVNLLQGGWKKKLLLLVIFSFVSIVVIRDRHGNFDQLEQLRKRLLVCTHYSDSLVTQLEVIQRYKTKIESLIEQQKNVSGRTSENLESRIRELTFKNDRCQNELLDYKKTNRDSENVVQIKNENAQYRTRIDELNNKIGELNKQLKSTNIEEKPVNLTIIKEVPDPVNPLPQVPPPEPPKLAVASVENERKHRNEAQVYANGPNVHFHRNRPLDEPLEFRRDGENELAPVAGLLPQNELVKKIEDRERSKIIEKEASVEDFRDAAKPDGDEMDYKEMEH